MPNGLPYLKTAKNLGEYEIAISLFEQCNLSCSFCFQGHSKTPQDPSLIKMIPQKILGQIMEDLKNKCPKNIGVRIWGGEVFSDVVSDELFDSYYDIIDEIKSWKYVLPFDTNISIIFLSNGVFTKTERVKQLLLNTGSFISFSYDPVGRYQNEEQRKLWFKNFIELKDEKTSISMTMSKSNIDALLAGDEYFLKIPKNVQISFNYYTPTVSWKREMASEEDIYNLYKYTIKNKFFNVYTVQELLRSKLEEEKDFNPHCDCEFQTHYSKGQCVKDCVHHIAGLKKEEFYGSYTDEVNEENCGEVKASIGLLKRGCLSCEYNERCIKFCWSSVIFNEYKVNECPLKRILDEITEEDIKEFRKWFYDQH